MGGMWVTYQPRGRDVGDIPAKWKEYSIYCRNKTGINTLLKLRSNKQCVSIVSPALIISLELFQQKCANTENKVTYQPSRRNMGDIAAKW